MTKSRWTLRTFPGGAAAATKSYSAKLHADDSTLQSGNTDADGAVAFSPNLSPGPYYITGTDTTPDPDAVRVTSSKSSGSGGAYSLAEIPLVLRAFQKGVIDGYLNELAVTYDGAGLDLDVDTGAAIAKGIPTAIHTATEHTVTTSRDAANPKACYLVLEFTGVGEVAEGKVVLKDVCGAAAASPSLPSLTQTEATFQLALATFTLPTTASTTLTSLVDVRNFVGVRNPVVTAVARRTDPAVATNITSTVGDLVVWTSGDPDLTLLNGVVYDLTVTTFLLVKAPMGQTVSLASRVDSVTGTYIDSNVSADYVGLLNVTTTSGVVGSGGSVVNGARVKVSGGTGSYLTGCLLVVAVPRS